MNAIFEDSRGYFWFATAGGGVCRFDGKEFVQYEERNGLAGQIVTGIAEDKEGNLWFTSTWGGISRFDGKSFRIFSVEKNNLVTDAFQKVFYDRHADLLYFAGKAGLVIYDNKEFRQLTSLDGIIDINIRSFHQLSDGSLFIATNKGVFSGKKADSLKVIMFTKGKSYNSITSDSSDIWFAGEEEILVIDRKTMQRKPLPFLLAKSEYIKSPGFRKVHCSSTGDIWIDSYSNGIALLRKNELVLLDQKTGFGKIEMLSIYTDRNKRTWIGTNGSGVIRFNGFAFTYFDNFPGLRSNDIFSICEDRKGNFWFASSTKGVFVYNGKTVENINTSQGLPSNSFRAMICDTNGTLWMGSREGLVRYDNGRIRVYNVSDGLPDNNIRSLCEGRNGVIWIGTGGGGLASYDRKKFRTYGEKEGLTHNYVHSIHEDSKGNLWVGTGIGLFHYENEKFTLYNDKFGLCNTYIGSIVEDKTGNIWVGTDKCIARFSGKKFTTYDVSDGLTSATVFLMTFDDQGDLIVGTNKGFDKIKLSTYGQIVSIENYSYADGFTGIECNSRSVFNDSNGNIWFGTVKGVILYKPEEELEFNNAPHIHILSVKLFYDDKWMQKSELSGLNWFGIPNSAEFRHDQNNISFTVNGICTLYPDQIRYSYYLKGFDKTWTPVTNNPSVSYSNLPPGEYEFQAKAQAQNGKWSSPPAVFAFSIKPAFWQTWWFYLFLLAVVIYTVYYINILMQRNVMRYNEILEEKVTSRTNEILKQKEEKEVLLKEIHHRVKNNMQVIVSLLNIHSEYIKDPMSLALIEDSKNRIKSMALIHEKLYESKDLSRINISEYLDELINDLVGTYGIKTPIKIDKKIEVNSFGFDTLIPLGLLLNEIISNSLKYAFEGRDEGTIIFHLSRLDDKFELIVGDNGIGMKKEQFSNPSKTLGLDLISILTEQLNGTIELINKEGTIFRIIFESIDKRRI